MPEEARSAPAGWYPSPNGGRRYWDGTRWLDLPDPAAESVRTQQKRPFPKKFAAFGLAALVFLGGAGVMWKVGHDGKIAAEKEAAADAADKREADQLAAQRQQDDAKRATRAAAVTRIEASVDSMARDHIARGLIDGTVISVTCSPVSGGSTDDLTETTTVFDCFVANENNGDGTLSGYKYNATMNWNSGQYTYGMGAP
nr:DUF2510 domain-containing protein [Rhodococcus wratislaviensis]GLK37628.1 hypothetical protein GCM10017611_44930 [Rhodococcus wratislaviensis]